ncbi:MAG: protein kinase family protein [Candidatus Margulisiibacteriota bacterium]
MLTAPLGYLSGRGVYPVQLPDVYKMAKRGIVGNPSSERLISTLIGVLDKNPLLVPRLGELLDNMAVQKFTRSKVKSDKPKLGSVDAAYARFYRELLSVDFSSPHESRIRAALVAKQSRPSTQTIPIQMAAVSTPDPFAGYPHARDLARPSYVQEAAPAAAAISPAPVVSRSLDPSLSPEDCVSTLMSVMGDDCLNSTHMFEANTLLMPFFNAAVTASKEGSLSLPHRDYFLEIWKTFEKRQVEASPDRRVSMVNQKMMFLMVLDRFGDTIRETLTPPVKDIIIFTHFESRNKLQPALGPSKTPKPVEALPSGTYAFLNALSRDEQQLGRGSFGRVRLAHQLDSDQTVAHKKQAPRTFRELFSIFREVAMHDRLQKVRSVASILDAHQYPGKKHFIGILMPLAQGSFSEVVQSRDHQINATPHTYAAGLPLWRGLVEAAKSLRDIHAEGVVHQDFKAENLLVDVEGHVQLSDLGFTVPVGVQDLEALGFNPKNFGGTFYPPEALSVWRSPQDVAKLDLPKVDTWAFGVSLLRAVQGDDFSKYRDHVLVGERGSSDQNPIFKWSDDAKLWVDRVLLRSNNANLQDMGRLILDCLQEDPAARPTMDQVCRSSWVLRNSGK